MLIDQKDGNVRSSLGKLLECRLDHRCLSFCEPQIEDISSTILKAFLKDSPGSLLSTTRKFFF